MSWRDWFGYPGMLDDELDRAMVESIKVVSEGIVITAKATSERIALLEARVRALEEQARRPPVSAERPFGLGGMTREEYAAWRQRQQLQQRDERAG